MECTHGCTEGHSPLPLRSPMTTKEKVLFVVEKICDIVLVVFSICAAPQYFIPGFIIGLGWTLYDQVGKPIKRSEHALSCSQSVLERMAGVHFPPLIRIAAEAATILCHVHHHAPVFAPLVGFSAGTWVTRQSLWLWNGQRARKTART